MQRFGLAIVQKFLQQVLSRGKLPTLSVATLMEMVNVNTLLREGGYGRREKTK
jgi:hypothetical protein